MEHLSNKYFRNPDYIFRRIVEDMILVPIHQDIADMNCIYTLNEVGALLWEKLEKPLSSEELQAVVLEEYSIDAITASGDVASFLSEMEKIGAVKRVV